jgi:hypothetical protein
MKFSIIILFTVLFSATLFPQAPDTLWTKTFRGFGDDRGNSVQQTNDGGYIIAGMTHYFGSGNRDVWLIKTDANGDTFWTKTIGNRITSGKSVQQTF